MGSVPRLSRSKYIQMYIVPSQANQSHAVVKTRPQATPEIDTQMLWILKAELASDCNIWHLLNMMSIPISNS